jgi:hypothetical protein
MNAAIDEPALDLAAKGPRVRRVPGRARHRDADHRGGELVERLAPQNWRDVLTIGVRALLLETAAGGAHTDRDPVKVPMQRSLTDAQRLNAAQRDGLRHAREQPELAARVVVPQRQREVVQAHDRPTPSKTAG